MTFVTCEFCHISKVETSDVKFSIDAQCFNVLRWQPLEFLTFGKMPPQLQQQQQHQQQQQQQQPQR